jgi:hypothetical protein
MKAILKNETALTILATVAILAVGCVVLPLVVTLGCKALLFIFEKPLMALTATSAFLIGMFVNEKLK